MAVVGGFFPPPLPPLPLPPVVRLERLNCGLGMMCCDTPFAFFAHADRLRTRPNEKNNL
ncbi:hypothetical protein GCM10007362_07450 [Saccharibacillus endophyticus]|uniref:Uncharacterized protein n=1 Tax=Saccharibacillus endophyticus TaxID=2060666 RepID=A0ABQ1ZQ89_9BACL|nr:hypothetical protein GCM10007362_07450 [Saccharibacillus endophyticus]